jgi:hypothetical protein
MKLLIIQSSLASRHFLGVLCSDILASTNSDDDYDDYDDVSSPKRRYKVMGRSLAWNWVRTLSPISHERAQGEL